MFKSLAKLFATETASPSLDARLCVEGMERRFSPAALTNAGVPVLSGTHGASVGPNSRSSVATAVGTAPAVTCPSDSSAAVGHWFMTVGG